MLRLAEERLIVHAGPYQVPDRCAIGLRPGGEKEHPCDGRRTPWLDSFARHQRSQKFISRHGRESRESQFVERRAVSEA
jgi:hypothetical protein